jgi:uncharacterized protein YdaU (DUF1376 family)
MEGYEMHFYPHHIGDFLKDTSSLTPEESYYYLRLIWLYYDTEKPLPDDIPSLAFKIGARGKEDCVRSLVQIYFTYDSDLKSHTHQRIEDEIRKYQSKAASAKRANQIRWGSEKDLKSDLKSDAKQIPTKNQEPRTREGRATRLPPDWEPSDQLIAFMAKERPDLNPSHTIMKFCNYWQAKSGKDATKLDWDKTFQNWVLQEKEGKAKPASFDPFAGAL